MSLRQAVSKLLLPNLDRELSRSMATELSTVSNMVENMLAGTPQVYGYAAAKPSGAFKSSEKRQEFVKVHYPSPKENGLFQDKESWH